MPFFNDSANGNLAPSESTSQVFVAKMASLFLILMMLLGTFMHIGRPPFRRSLFIPKLSSVFGLLSHRSLLASITSSARTPSRS